MNPSLALVEEDEELPDQGQEAEAAGTQERRERRRADDLDGGVVVDLLLQLHVVPHLGPPRVTLVVGSGICAETAPSAQVTIVPCRDFVLLRS